MARITTPLTDKEIKAALPKDKPYRLFDGGGLYIEITPKGQKWWRLKYRFNGKEKRIGLGVYPNISLAAARLERDRMKMQIANGIDPMQERQAAKERNREESRKNTHTFERLTDEYFKHKASLEDAPNEKTLQKAKNRIAKHCYPTLKAVPVQNITEEDILKIIWKLRDESYHEIARRVLQLVKAILRYGVRRKYISHNVAADILPQEEIGKKTSNNFPVLTERKALKELLLAIDSYTGDYSTKQALKIMPYLAFRPINIRFLEWEEVNLTEKIITIDASKMKMKRDFVCPVSAQAYVILKEMQRYSGDGKYVFPSMVHRDRPLSENTLNVALRRLGYEKKQIVSHSFRGIFSTIAHEHTKDHGCSSLAIEMQLAHEDTNTIRGTYNRSLMLEERRILVQWYADYLEGVKYA